MKDLNFSKTFDGLKESDIEKYLVKEIARLGGTAYKFTSPGRRSVPDRLCVMPLGIVLFVECKKPRGILTELQKAEMQRLHDKDQWATTVFDKGDVDNLIIQLQRDLNARYTYRHSSDTWIIKKAGNTKGAS